MGCLSRPRSVDSSRGGEHCYGGMGEELHLEDFVPRGRETRVVRSQKVIFEWTKNKILCLSILFVDVKKVAGTS